MRFLALLAKSPRCPYPGLLVVEAVRLMSFLMLLGMDTQFLKAPCLSLIRYIDLPDPCRVRVLRAIFLHCKYYVITYLV